MNILPHKSWHVRTKKNIARVRKDELEAAEQEKEKQRRIDLAEQEARTTFLRDRAKDRFQTASNEPSILQVSTNDDVEITQSNGHINFFQDLEEGKKLDSEINKEHEDEKKREQEEYEKKIGYLVYLGQNSNELTKDKPWYENETAARPASSSSNIDSVESRLILSKQDRSKEFDDPLKDIRKYLKKPSNHMKRRIETNDCKHKLDKFSSSSKEEGSSKSKKAKKEKKKKSKSKHKKKSKKDYTSEDSDSVDEESFKSKKEAKLKALRIERLEREKEERRRAEKLILSLNSSLSSQLKDSKKQQDQSRSCIRSPQLKQKYNSQFNPHLARQNFEEEHH